MKKKLIAGNWKMNGGLAANEALAKALLGGLSVPACNVAVCAPAPYLAQLQVLLANSAIALGAQDVSAHESGAYTGEVSVAMLKEFDVRYASSVIRSAVSTMARPTRAVASQGAAGAGRWHHAHRVRG
jgi:triosephosphate isomerase